MADTVPTPNDPKYQWLAVALGVSARRAGTVSRPAGAPAGRSSVPAAQAGEAAPDVSSGPQPVTTLGKIKPVDMKDEDIAAQIMDEQAAVIVGWQTALQVFDKTMTSSSDKDATPQFQKVVVDYFAEKLMGAMMKK